MANFTINKLVVIGVGLIGGSFALALRQAGQVGRIVGVGRSAENLQLAIQHKVIDSIAANIPEALQGADLVMLAMPVGQSAQVFSQLAPHLDAATIITDAGSTKQDVIAAARQHLGEHFKNFVPGHPIAGAEQSGVAAASTDLFRDKNVVLTPLPETRADAVDIVTDLWQACGAKVTHMLAAEHDKILAAMSHLPHVLAFALMRSVGNHTHPQDLLRFAGSGFRDFTRIAASSPEMWRDICIANRVALLQQIDSYQNELTAMRDMLEQGDAAGLEQAFAQAKAVRQEWLKK